MGLRHYEVDKKQHERGVEGKRGKWKDTSWVGMTKYEYNVLSFSSLLRFSFRSLKIHVIWESCWVCRRRFFRNFKFGFGRWWCASDLLRMPAASIPSKVPFFQRNRWCWHCQIVPKRNQIALFAQIICMLRFISVLQRTQNCDALVKFIHNPKFSFCCSESMLHMCSFFRTITSSFFVWHAILCTLIW